MKTGHRFYITGFILAIVLSIIGELIWLGDLIRFGNIFWIDDIQVLASILVLVPVVWVIGAVVELLGRSQRGWMRLHQSLIIISGVVAVLLTIISSEKVVTIAIWAGAALILTLIDIVRIELRHGKRVWRSLVWPAALLLLGLLLFYPTAYGVTSPGFTLNMNRYAHVEGGQPKGSIEGVLVIERPAFPIDWLFAAIFPSIDIEKRDTSISLGEMQQMAQSQRAGANEIASAVALGKLGIGKGVIPTGVHILSVLQGSPSVDKLEPDDIITSVNGEAVLSGAELTGILKREKPGAKVSVGFSREGKAMTETLQTAAAANDPTRAILGITIEDLVKTDIPRKVDFRSYLVYQGGPSHGAILTLTLLDQLTPEGVTYGNSVAGTGTISADGTVGDIGGIKQKAYAVAHSGADVFFVPADQEEEAREGSATLNIVPVHTLDQMLAWLKAHPK